MVANTMENGIKNVIKSMEEVYKNGKKALHILDILKLIRQTEKGNLYSQKEKYMRDIGLIIEPMD
jgi:hypothetical protein